MRLRIDLRKSKLELIKLFVMIEEQLQPGSYIVNIEMEDDRTVKARKHYFSLVTELGKHLGYLGRTDRELFKEQVRMELGGESLAEMHKFEDVYTKIEELHEFAYRNFGYTFKPWIPEENNYFTKEPDDGAHGNGQGH